MPPTSSLNSMSGRCERRCGSSAARLGPPSWSGSRLGRADRPEHDDCFLPPRQMAIPGTAPSLLLSSNICRRRGSIWARPSASSAAQEGSRGSCGQGFRARALADKQAAEKALANKIANDKAAAELAAKQATDREVRIELLCLNPRPRTAHGAGLRHHSYRGVPRPRWLTCAASVRD